ncbi:transcriptional activator protein Dal81p [[Candida] anglica]|uniref:Transcriptional activator protein Dal81p n=1 Tax=[Candida] anglica TaxID=148631 RepID=A0ABP0EHT2_9ASCO
MNSGSKSEGANSHSTVPEQGGSNSTHNHPKDSMDHTSEQNNSRTPQQQSHQHRTSQLQHIQQQQQLQHQPPPGQPQQQPQQQHHHQPQQQQQQQLHHHQQQQLHHQQHSQHPHSAHQDHPPNGPEYDSAQYLDSNWASSLLMDPNNEMFYGMDFTSPNMGINTAPAIQNQGQYQSPTSENMHLPPQQQQQGHPGQPHGDNEAKGPTSHPQQTPSALSQSQGTPTDIQMVSDSNYTSTGSVGAQQRAAKHRRPCDHCRRRKTKCVIIPNTNNCAQCESKSLVCTYIDQPMRRTPGSNPNFQEDYYNNIQPQNKRAKTSSTNDAMSGNTNANLSILQRENHISNGIVPPNVQIRDVPPVQDYSMVNNSLLKKTLSLQFPRSSFYVGPTSYLYDVNLLNLIIESQNSPSKKGASQSQGANKSTSINGRASASPLGGKIEQVNLSDSISLRKVSDKVQFVLKDDQSPQSYSAMSQDVDNIEKFIAPHGQILIDLYFRIIHPSYPILHKKVFLEKYSRTHREFSAPLLAAVYVLAIQWWDYDPQLNRYPKPNSELILKIALNNYLLEILKRPKLSAVQAGLLLLQCKHIIQVSNISSNGNSNGEPTPNSSGGDTDYNDWVLCSQVISLAEELGLGLDCHGWKLPKWERGLRKRLAWAVYMEDKWLSLKNARPSHISENNWIVLPLADEDFPEKHGDGDLKEGSSDIDNGKKIFRNLIDLSMILSDIVDQFYSMKAMNEITDMTQVLKLAKPLQLKLRNWYHSLPVELQMSSVQRRKLCSNGYLQLAYFATELTLHRKIITTIFQQSHSNNPPQPELVNVCRTAAKTRLLASIEFVRDLKPEHIHSFWHSSSSSSFTLIGTFAAVLFISSTTKEEEDFYKDQVFNYRWILKISSKGFDQVGAALSKLDLVLNHIPGLLIDKVGVPMVVPNVPTVDYQRQSQQSPPHPQQSQQSQARPNNQFTPQSQGKRLSNSDSTSGSNVNNNTNTTNNNNRRIGRPPQGARPTQQPQSQSQQGAGSAYISSPQQFSTPPYSQVQPMPQTMSRGGQFIVNSPQSSQGLSPKEVIRQQRPVGPNPVTKGNSTQEDQESIGTSFGDSRGSPPGPFVGPAYAHQNDDDNRSTLSDRNTDK